MIPIALSPCPNDTFLFFAWISGKVGSHLPCNPTFLDIQQLNQEAQKERFPLTKLSFYALSQLRDKYDLLPIGAALGDKQGPKIIAKSPFTLSELSKKKIAIPGEQTTAHLLLRLLAPEPMTKHFCLYHEVAALVNNGVVDCGLIIHESRFTFTEQGFFEIEDLGELFFQKFQIPLPLGALALHKSYAEKKEQIISILEESLCFAKNNKDLCTPFILSKSQDKDPKVVQAHIDLYVNEETKRLSSQGMAAIHRFYELIESIE